MMTWYCLKSAKRALCFLAWSELGLAKREVSLRFPRWKASSSHGHTGKITWESGTAATHIVHIVPGGLDHLVGVGQYPFFQQLPDPLPQLLHGKVHQLFCTHPNHQSRKLRSKDHHEFQGKTDTGSSLSSQFSLGRWPPTLHARFPFSNSPSWLRLSTSHWATHQLP